MVTMTLIGNDGTYIANIEAEEVPNKGDYIEICGKVRKLYGVCYRAFVIPESTRAVRSVVVTLRFIDILEQGASYSWNSA